MGMTRRFLFKMLLAPIAAALVKSWPKRKPCGHIFISRDGKPGTWEPIYFRGHPITFVEQLPGDIVGIDWGTLKVCCECGLPWDPAKMKDGMCEPCNEFWHTPKPGDDFGIPYYIVPFGANA